MPDRAEQLHLDLAGNFATREDSSSLFPVPWNAVSSFVYFLASYQWPIRSKDGTKAGRFLERRCYRFGTAKKAYESVSVEFGNPKTGDFCFSLWVEGDRYYGFRVGDLIIVSEDAGFVDEDGFARFPGMCYRFFKSDTGEEVSVFDPRWDSEIAKMPKNDVPPTYSSDHWDLRDLFVCVRLRGWENGTYARFMGKRERWRKYASSSLIEFTWESLRKGIMGK